jgi:hypothetical protein
VCLPQLFFSLPPQFNAQFIQDGSSTAPAVKSSESLSHSAAPS